MGTYPEPVWRHEWSGKKATGSIFAPSAAFLSARCWWCSRPSFCSGASTIRGRNASARLILDQVIPAIDWILVPMTHAAEMLENMRSYGRIHTQNLELRRELRKMRAWKRSSAIQLEQENARLRTYNNVKPEPDLTFITGTGRRR